MSFFKNSKIGTTLNVLVIIASVACIILSILGFLGLKKGEHASNTMYEDSLLPIQWIGAIESNFYLINMNVKETILSKDQERIKELLVEIDVARTETDQLIKKFESRVSSNKEKELYTTFHAVFNELRTQLRKVQDLGQSNNEEAYAYYLKEVDPNMKKAVQAIRELIQVNNNNADQLQKNNTASATNTIMLFVSISIIAIAIVIFIGYIIKSAIRQPIVLLERDMEKVSAGDLTIRTSYKSDNELGSIVRSFNSMLDNLQQLIGEVKITTQEVISSTNGMLQDTKRASHISREVVQTISEVDKKIEGQVTSIQESSSSMEEIATGVQTVAESSATVTEVAVTTTEQVNSGSEVIKQSILQMNSIHEVVEETSKVIERLVMRTQQIDKALDAITNIAEQTNLLALNASIEAARAGENGKGFAVVAAEVGNLAEQSKASADEINHLILAIQQDTKDTVDAMQKGQQKASEGKETANKADQAFSSIMVAINKITSQIQEVSAATEEMSAGTEEVNASMSSVSETAAQVAKETTQTVQSIQSQAASIEEISNQSNKIKEKVEALSELVSKFISEEQGKEK
ncbi:methyl-accepting chemotaxis protein (plasmid) [Bacillus albus]|uniref:methyl-accepting chemotaxis protein n=1 Tax=Bacillus cereus group TaxID=86661 RepID=UPI0022DEF9BD|nr:MULTISPECIES: methyl-accepting chemotaxis protein [Bacillus cereus group]MDA2030005.1 methyl-accepting chemotaxis protein [Bacillus cereus group sp. Bcc03]MDA2219285.1 methyl-accepting chemotaxis protein [Bacillus cereus group sp. Bc228]MDA2230997.1 methyl-accepting chemotaxis protein [Bacillus cereus group sp. Bc227]MDA2263623.1 methyl-accepting chemotaxis protein [Bacillus cereus group sp. Bc200]MDA2716113.1 methyl-accepting chemotaxis protein [Bacillus cereus group sp. Bc025]